MKSKSPKSMSSKGLSEETRNDVSWVRLYFKHIIFSIILIAFGIILIIFLGMVFKSFKDHPFYIIFEHIATALIIAGIWHSISQFFIWKDLIKTSESITNRFITTEEKNKDEIIKLINTAKKDAKLGLIDTYHDVSAFSFSDFVVHPKDLSIVLSDGADWVTYNIESLRLRINDSQKTTKFFFIHPDSKVVETFGKKIKFYGEYRNRIISTIDFLNEEIKVAEKNKEASILQVSIYGHFSIPHHAVYLGDRLVITPYFFSYTKRNPPVFIFEKGSFVSKVQEDLNDLEKDSENLLQWFRQRQN